VEAIPKRKRKSNELAMYWNHDDVHMTTRPVSMYDATHSSGLFPLLLWSVVVVACCTVTTRLDKVKNRFVNRFGNGMAI
jgi:hypothetical protein